MSGFFYLPRKVYICHSIINHKYDSMKKSLQAKSLNRSDLKTVVGGLIWNDERGGNVEDRRCGRKYGAPPCKDSHDLMK